MCEHPTHQVNVPRIGVLQDQLETTTVVNLISNNLLSELILF